MSGIYQLVVEYDADVNRAARNDCVDRNPFVVDVLVDLGADRTTRSWDFQIGVHNTPIHRAGGCKSFTVYEALVFNLPLGGLDAKAECGFTAQRRRGQR